jgi:CheY-like chemotaxis protein
MPGLTETRISAQKRRTTGWWLRHGQCRRARVFNCVALLAEPDRALRSLMSRMLTATGYVVAESSNELQLEAGLRVQPFLGARNALLVLALHLATRSARHISTASRERVRAGLPHAHVILTCEMGTLATLRLPDLAACVSVGVLEKPFDLHELRALSLKCLHPPKVSGDYGA